MSCKRCNERGKPWKGQDPTCGFPGGHFNQDNWNCATLNELRILVGASNAPSLGLTVGTVHAGDERLGVAADPDGNDFLLVRWYKDRGRTESLRWYGTTANLGVVDLTTVEFVLDYYQSLMRHRA